MKYETLDTLIERIVEEREAQVDMLADTRRMSADVEEGEVWLSVDEGETVTSMMMSPHAQGQMATDLEIPKRYFDRMAENAPELFQRNVHHWLYAKPKRKMLRARTVDEGGTLHGRAWLSDSYRRLDNIEIATRLLPEFDRLPEKVQFHNASVTDETFYLRATFPSMERAVKVGDTVRWGVQIRNSEVGAAQFKIESFMLRLVCTNGMVGAKVMNARHVGKRLGENLSDEAIRADDKAFWLAARDELRAALDQTAFEAAVAQLTDAANSVKVQSTPEATKRLAKTFSLTDAEQDMVLTNFALGGDITRWGALNAVTATAKTAENFDRGVELEEIGWSIAGMTTREGERIAA